MKMLDDAGEKFAVPAVLQIGDGGIVERDDPIVGTSEGVTNWFMMILLDAKQDWIKSRERAA